MDEQLKVINLFIDGKGYVGEVMELSLPSADMEPAEARFVLASYDRTILAAFGVRESAPLNCTFRGLLESKDGTETPAAHVMRGRIESIAEASTPPSGELPPLAVRMVLDYWRFERAGNVVQELGG